MKNRENKEGLKTLVGVILRRRWVILGFVVVGVGLGAYKTFTTRPQYRARATIVVNRRTPALLPGMRNVLDTEPAGYWVEKNFINTQLRIIKSRAIAKRVVQRLGLQDDDDFLGISKNKDSTTKELSADERMKAAIGKVMGELKIDNLEDSNIIEIVIQDTDKHRAVQIADAYAMSYKQYQMETRRNRVAQAYADLRELVADMKARSEASENLLYEFEKKNNVGTIETRMKELGMSLDNYTLKYNEAHSNLLQLKAVLQELNKVLKNKDVVRIPTSGLIDAPLVQSLKEKYVDQITRLKQMESRYLPDHPECKALKAQVETLKKAILDEVQSIVAGYQAKYNEVKQLERSYLSELDSLRKEEYKLAWKQVKYQRLMENSKEDKAFYRKILRRQTETQLTGEVVTSNTDILERAVEPKAPVLPRPKANLAISLMGGLIAGLLAAFALEGLDTTVESPEFIEDELGTSNLGVLPLVKNGGKGERELYVIKEPESSYAEAMRVVRTNLMFAGGPEDVKSVVITSPSAKEGKSTIVANLAAAIATSGSSVVIVDGDMRRASIHHIFGVKSVIGLSNYLAGQVDIDASITHTSVQGLDIITRGAVPPNPAELLHGERFPRLIEALQQRYDYVLFDSPPVLGVSDALIAAGVIKRTILVARHGSTAKSALLEAKERIDGVGAKCVGAILNMIDLEKKRYGYYYKYYKKSYYTSKEDK